jgi:hypothetical protein
MWLRRVLPYTSAGVVVALIYTGWTFYSRWADTRLAEERAAAAKLAFDQKTLDMIGSDLKITQFYASGTLVCYGVANAKSVKIDPPIEAITPSLSRCLQAPHKSADYTLTAEDEAGHSVSQTITVKVQ